MIRSLTLKLWANGEVEAICDKDRELLTNYSQMIIDYNHPEGDVGRVHIDSLLNNGWKICYLSDWKEAYVTKEGRMWTVAFLTQRTEDFVS